MEETSELIGLDIYTPKGIFVGKVADMRVDIADRNIDGLIVKDVNPALAEDNIILSIPFSWIEAIGDVVILKRFPDRILRDGTLQGL